MVVKPIAFRSFEVDSISNSISDSSENDSEKKFSLVFFQGMNHSKEISEIPISSVAGDRNFSFFRRKPGAPGASCGIAYDPKRYDLIDGRYHYDPVCQRIEQIAARCKCAIKNFFLNDEGNEFYSCLCTGGKQVTPREKLYNIFSVVQVYDRETKLNWLFISARANIYDDKTALCFQRKLQELIGNKRALVSLSLNEGGRGLLSLTSSFSQNFSCKEVNDRSAILCSDKDAILSTKEGVFSCSLFGDAEGEAPLVKPVEKDDSEEFLKGFDLRPEREKGWVEEFDPLAKPPNKVEPKKKERSYGLLGCVVYPALFLWWVAKKVGRCISWPFRQIARIVK